MKIALLEPYYTGSHREWANSLRQLSQHDIEIFSLPGQNWKWRMHGGAITLAEEFNARGGEFDLILATDMLDLSSFYALTRAQLPSCIYFHENQFTYPWPERDRDVAQNSERHYGFINYISALAADRVFFNSDFHRQSFLGALPDFLKSYSDYNNFSTVEQIKAKSEVLHLGVDFSVFDEARPTGLELKRKYDKPIILWNHRWEHDKNPKGFFNTLYQLQEQKIEFHLVVLGESFGHEQQEFSEAKQRLAAHIIQWGRLEDKSSYAKWLWASDIVFATSNHDFFGMSIVEAMYCETIPLLPDRLVYPEILGEELQQLYLYQDCDRLEQTVKILSSARSIDRNQIHQRASSFSWGKVISDYDQRLYELCGSPIP